MNANHPGHRTVRAWVLYDAECQVCARLARRFEKILARRGFELAPLQSPWVREKLGLGFRQLPAEMRLLFPDGRHLGGADAIVSLARQIWWAWPLWLLSRFPGATSLLRRQYRRFAANRRCFNGACQLETRERHHGATTFFEFP